MVRDEPIDKLLYQDAMRRQKRKNENAKRKTFKQKKNISSNSEQIYAKKFLKEFDTVVMEVLSHRNLMDFDEMC
jgi:hypothetical protein